MENTTLGPQPGLASDGGEFRGNNHHRAALRRTVEGQIYPMSPL